MRRARWERQKKERIYPSYSAVGSARTVLEVRGFKEPSLIKGRVLYTAG